VASVPWCLRQPRTPALARLAKRFSEFSTTEKEVLDLSVQEVWDERMHEAGLTNDPVAFRVAVRGWEQAGLETMERVRVKGGAA
jgi:hypothetical protein